MRIEFKNVDFSVGDHHIIDDVSFLVESGETFVLVGYSGSGKSTLLKLLLGLYEPDPKRTADSGIFVDYQDVTTFNEKQWRRVRRSMALVFQQGALFDSLDVRENVGYRLFEENQLPSQDIEGIVDQALSFVGLPDVKSKMPWELSGGMRKRVSLARALASGAETILFDEPTSGLDPFNAINITNLISALKDTAELTSIVVTHELNHAYQMASHIALLEEGRVVFVGTPDAMQSSSDEQVKRFISPEGSTLISCELDKITHLAEKRRAERLCD